MTKIGFLTTNESKNGWLRSGKTPQQCPKAKLTNKEVMFTVPVTSINDNETSSEAAPILESNFIIITA